jgi:hypothetical protein
MLGQFFTSLSSIPLLSSGRTRSISPENMNGEPGSGGRAASVLGPGRKGSPCVTISRGETRRLVDVKGPGVMQHFWLTVPSKPDARRYVLRDLILRMYWDGETTPSVEVPLGDFFCNGFGVRANVNSLPMVVNPSGGMNCYFPMPFGKSAVITIENQQDQDVSNLFYQFTYSLLDELPKDAAYFHAQWRRTETVTRGQDHVLVEGLNGPGHYVGTYLALASLGGFWWGEGEMKFFIDDDEEFPTICGTGTEDYFGGAWCFYEEKEGRLVEQTYSTPFLGYPLCSQTSPSGGSRFSDVTIPTHAMYRWHIVDPVRFRKRLTVAVQDIGHDGHSLFERSDDISSVSYWYQSEPHAAFPLLPGRTSRTPR